MAEPPDQHDSAQPGALASSPASPTEGDRLLDLFGAVLDLPDAERATFLADACGDDVTLRDEILSLLAVRRDGITLLFADAIPQRTLLAAGARRAFDDAAPDADVGSEAPLPTHVGPFAIRRVLGRGGAGVVYLAEQGNPRRMVAVKRLDATLASDALRERFAREVSVLARLDHPGIPALLDAGLDDDGRPWFALPYVDGRPLVDFAHAERLDRRARVELVARVCDAVGAAHRAEVVHRDLKPDNVLVDAHGAPHVLDFGIARTLDGSAAHEALTAHGHVLGTLAYMSPEQALGDPSATDARADVYALGVLLYELLAGRLPHEVRGRTLHESLRRIAEFDAPPLDTGDRDDLPLVVGKALAREPARRYTDADALARDLRRWLDGRPVEAHAPGALYRARRFAARHRTLAAGILLGALTLLAGFGVALAHLVEARDAEHRAEARRSELLGLSDERRLAELVAEADTLWPATPARLAAYDAWLDEADALLARRAAHASTAAALSADGSPTSERAWELDVLERLLASLDTFASDDWRRGTRADVARRRAHAALLRDEPHAGLWDEAARAVAASPDYTGLVLTPQVGLVPLGADPHSGLQEFAEAGWTGRVPVRDARSGELALDAESALVFVLIPGGEVLLGAQSTDPVAPRFDADALDHEGPPQHVRLDPFLIAKHELSIAQWRRFTGDDPGPFADGTRWYDEDVGATHPVGGLSWRAADAVLARLGLRLPTEAQWETAARGGTATPFWPGRDVAALGDALNVGDRGFLRASHEPAAVVEASPFDDGHPGLAAVDAGTPNPFGLHGVHGNLWEFTRDVFRTTLDVPRRPGDGLVLTAENGLRTVRGGSFTDPWYQTRVSFRTDADEQRASRTYGVRPARALEGVRRDD
ncbi:MAG: SUMF1/EgtB/PvdO family nonheme iron enzyme [Planctomycetes bacterium]|nr:SUMF1/EgtB/PvdO family nonheme iron enzyme [Planctomycetota bacterium]